MKPKKPEKSDAEKFIDYLENLLPVLIEEFKKPVRGDYSEGLSKGRVAAYEGILEEIKEFREGKHFCQGGE